MSFSFCALFYLHSCIPDLDQFYVIFHIYCFSSRFKLKWEYLPQESAVLLDKIYKFDHITTYELGGEAAERVLHNKGNKTRTSDLFLCPVL